MIVLFLLAKGRTNIHLRDIPADSESSTFRPRSGSGSFVFTSTLIDTGYIPINSQGNVTSC